MADTCFVCGQTEACTTCARLGAPDTQPPPDPYGTLPFDFPREED